MCSELALLLLRDYSSVGKELSVELLTAKLDSLATRGARIC